MKHMEYLDFDLEITHEAGRDYRVKAHSPAGEAEGRLRFPYDDIALENHLLKLQNALLRSGGPTRRALSPEEQAVQIFGRALFDALMEGDVGRRYAVCRARADQEDKGLRLRLHIHAPDLAALPWEYLFDHGQTEYLGLSRYTPIVRYLNLPRSREALTVAPPLRILGLVASPSSPAVKPLDVEVEQQRMERALAPLTARKLVELHWLEGHTWRDLQQALWPGRGPWHIFHFIGHGGFDEQTEEGLLALENDEGGLHLLSATHLGRVLKDHRSLRLVLLNACEGARAGKRDIFSSVGATLAQVGIPAVLAMQHEITDRAALELTRTFYEALAANLPVDAALTEARIAINIGINNSLEWGTPVLFLRASDSALFHLDGTLPPPVIQQPDPAPARQPDPPAAAPAALPATRQQPLPQGRPEQPRPFAPGLLPPAGSGPIDVIAFYTKGMRPLYTGEIRVQVKTQFAAPGPIQPGATITVRIWPAAQDAFYLSGPGITLRVPGPGGAEVGVLQVTPLRPTAPGAIDQLLFMILDANSGQPLQRNPVAADIVIAYQPSPPFDGPGSLHILG